VKAKTYSQKLFSSERKRLFLHNYNPYIQYGHFQVYLAVKRGSEKICIASLCEPYVRGFKKGIFIPKTKKSERHVGGGGLLIHSFRIASKDVLKQTKPKNQYKKYCNF
jgi:hypothetical protein